MSDISILPPHLKENQTLEKFGVYVHIPYCLQRCTYCDFATYVHTEILPSQKYVEILKLELQKNRHLYSQKKIDTLYFGGGTPSLIPAEQITSIIDTIKSNDFWFDPKAEITIEINPATVDEKKLNHYLEQGINRFSVGAQTFSNRLLKMVHREHSAQQTLDTLKLLESYKLNYSFDILFALPTQTLEELRFDLDQIENLKMSHISPYCLTVPEGHPLSKNRPLDVEQIEMFELIHSRLMQRNFHRYEISNYAKPGFESQHNLLYWKDQPFWGIGLSAHSYVKNSSWGTRFWNASNINLYEKQMTSQITHQFSEENSERLNKTQSLTDFCYTSLRLEYGLSAENLKLKFGESVVEKIRQIAQPLIDQKLMQYSDSRWSLTNQGVFISNQIFEKFTFLPTDFEH